MNKCKVGTITLAIALIMLSSTVAVFRTHAQPSVGQWLGYVKPSYTDYAPSGMPDFDEKQDQWGPGFYTWCCPVAVANSLWWLDSEYESMFSPSPVPPPTISDHFPLVSTYNPAWDDHNPKNVDPLVRNLAFLMDTDGLRSGDGHAGTRWWDIQNGIVQYLTQQGVSKYFEVHNASFPDFVWLNTEILKCQDVELILEFKQFTPGGWLNLTSNPSFEMGHCVTCAGVNASTSELLISDPWQDAYEMGTAPGRSPVAHLPGHNSTVHNDAQYVSQDAFKAVPYVFVFPPPPPLGYPPVVLELQGYLQTMGFDPSYHAFIVGAVATSPQEVEEWSGYVKPPFPDYATSGMVDFDEKQDQWGPGVGQYTWCCPVSVADSLWWLDSEYESVMFASPVAPPTISDHFSLVTAYGPWDDHDSSNVDPLVRNLAFLMDTDGQMSGDGHAGTRFADIQRGIQLYLAQQGVAGMFEVHNSSFPEFAWIDSETERCQDVELFLEFWQLTGLGWTNTTVTNPSLEFGHCVTCAGVNASTSELLISDPWQDAYEAGITPGRSPVPHLYPHNSAVHNDAQYVSQDAYKAVPYAFMIPPPPPLGYPPVVLELSGYLQTMGYDPSYHAFIRIAIATSPSGVHDIAVTNVTTCRTGCQPMPTVGVGNTIHVNVTVADHGSFDESFNVTAYANSTVIGTQYGVNLSSGNQTTVTFVWNTTGLAYGNYTISGYASPVDGETNTIDNTLPDGWVVVTLVGDIDGNFRVDMGDIVSLTKAFGSTLRSDGAYWHNPPCVNCPHPSNCDIDDNAKLDMGDIVASVKNFGKHYP